MKIPPRIAVPLLLAVLLAAVIGLLFLWQIHASVGMIESSFQSPGGNPGFIRKILAPPKERTSDSASQSQALIKLRQGEAFEYKGIWKQAEAMYADSVAAGGGVPALRKLAAIELQRREYDAARQTIDALKAESRGTDDVMLLEGILALRTGKLAAGEAVFRQKPDSPQSHYGLGLIAIARGDHEKAKAELARTSQGSDPTMRTYAETILQAYSEFALFPDGQDIHLKTLLARSLAQVNECETALSLIQGVVTQQSRYRDPWIVKGFCEFTTERTKDALASLEQAYSIDPEKPEIQYFLARTYDALGDPQNAVTFLQYAIVNGFSPVHDARELLVDYAQELGDITLALSQQKMLTDEADAPLSAFERYIDLASASQEHAPEGVIVARTALSRWPDNPTALALAAKAALAAGMPQEAQNYAASALKLDPKLPKALEVEAALNAALTQGKSSSVNGNRK
jgi:tetratricopeptide (TPR) repeat protein